MFNVKKSNGFTLLETIITLFISSLIISSAAILYSQYASQQKLRATTENIEQSKIQISYGFSTELAFPCPADRSLSPDDDNYLREFSDNCDASALATLSLTGGCQPSFTSGNVNTCWGCTDSGGLCVLPGSRNIAGDPNMIGDDIREFVVVGALPIRSLRQNVGMSVSDRSVVDGYGNLLNYAVSAGQAIESQYRFYEGVIAVVDENYVPTAGIDNDGHYVIYSSGPNGIGAFTPGGARVAECGNAATENNNEPVENENCDFDQAESTFVQAIDFSNVGEGGRRQYDDHLVVSKNASTSLWNTIGNSNHMANINTAGVALGTETPVDLLTVAGNVGVDGTVRTNIICNDISGSNDLCLDPALFTGPLKIQGDEDGNGDGFDKVMGLKCAEGMYITKIDLSEYTGPDDVGIIDANQRNDILGCEGIDFTGLSNGNCPEGEYITGIDAGGNIYCNLADFSDDYHPPRPPVNYHQMNGNFHDVGDAMRL